MYMTYVAQGNEVKEASKFFNRRNMAQENHAMYFAYQRSMHNFALKIGPWDISSFGTLAKSRQEVDGAYSAGDFYLHKQVIMTSFEVF